MFNTRRKKIIAAAAALAVTAAFFIFKNGSGSSSVKPKIGPVVEAVYALGTVKSDRWYNLRFGMNTVIQKLYVVEGRDVSAGESLLMTDSGVILKSPFSGKVTLLAYRETEMAPGGQTVLTVSGMRELYVRVSLDQESILSIRKGQEAVISFENLRDAKASGIVENVYPSGTEFVVRIRVDKFPDGVLPEMTCDAAITVRKKENAVMIPRNAVVNGKVTLVRNGKQLTIPATVKPVDDEWTEVTDDSVKSDDKIITSRNNQSSKNKLKKK